MKELQNKADFTSLMVMHEELKTMPFGDVWEEYLKKTNTLQIILQRLKNMKKKYWRIDNERHFNSTVRQGNVRHNG